MPSLHGPVRSGDRSRVRARGVAPVTEVQAQAQPADQLTVAFDVSIAPSFLEPAETPGIGTPFVFLYFAAPYEDMRLKTP